MECIKCGATWIHFKYLYVKNVKRLTSLLNQGMQKELKLLPDDFQISDTGIDVAAKIIRELIALGESREIIANTVFGFCFGYLCHQREQEPHV
jgi:GTPase Era involved in 16S rRNA processing